MNLNENLKNGAMKPVNIVLHGVKDFMGKSILMDMIRVVSGRDLEGVRGLWARSSYSRLYNWSNIINKISYGLEGGNRGKEENCFEGHS